MAIEIRPLSATEEHRWDEFVLQSPRGTPFHLTAWKKTIEEVFGYEPMYVAAFERGEIQGVLPLFLVRNLLIGKALLSTPFAVYGGAIAASDAARDALREHVEKTARELAVDYVELRNRHAEQRLGFSPVSRYVTFTQDIGPDEAAVLESIPRKTRYMVRKALKHPFSTRVTQDPANFERLYLENLRRLGTPAFPSKHFTTLLERFRGSIDIREVVLEDKVAAAVLTFYFRDQVLPYYGASDPAFNEYAPNNYMYFDLMRWGGAHDYRIYDFGRSKTANSGSFDFKAHWGMRMEELPYEILLMRGKELPNYSPNNPRLQSAIKVWQRVPLPVTRWLGPMFLRLVP